MFIFHFIKSRDDCVCVLFAPHATQSHTTYVISSRNTRAKGVTTCNWFFFFFGFEYYLMYILAYLFGFGIKLILLFNQMHCKTWWEGERVMESERVAAGPVTMIFRILIFLKMLLSHRIPLKGSCTAAGSCVLGLRYDRRSSWKSSRIFDRYSQENDRFRPRSRSRRVQTVSERVWMSAWSAAVVFFSNSNNNYNNSKTRA